MPILPAAEQGASALIRECSTIKFVPSLASFATTISYPAKTSHRAYSPEDMKAAGISMGQLRFSIGLEDAEDIIAELDEALGEGLSVLLHDLRLLRDTIPTAAGLHKT